MPELRNGVVTPRAKARQNRTRQSKAKKWLSRISLWLHKSSHGQNVSGRYKILYLDTFLGICIVSRYFFQKSIVSVSYRKFPKSIQLILLQSFADNAGLCKLHSTDLNVFKKLLWLKMKTNHAQIYTKTFCFIFLNCSFAPCMTFLILKPMFFNNTCTKSNLRIVSQQKYVSKMYRLQ